jgi:serine protease inhibitor
MKKQMIFPALLLLTLGPAACEQDDPVVKEPKKIEMNFKSAEIVKADRQFAFELFREACSLSDEENLMVSPLSVSYALGMTYNGARGTTLDAFNQVLHFDSLSSVEVNETYRDLMGQLVQLDNKVEFSIANSIWYKLGYPVLPDFISTNRDYFDAAVEELDFSDPGSVDVINGWIEDKTNDKIKDMLDYIPPDAVMYLVNAIYFNATWKYEFDKKDTYEGNFTLDDGSIFKTDFMSLEGDFNYIANEYFRAVELPYGDSAFSMVVIVPEYNWDARRLAAELDADSWDDWFDGSTMRNLLVEIPKFKYEFKTLLNQHLSNLGLGVAFTDAADFSGIVDGGGILISRVIHQTFIDVNEKGTEAAAATIVEMLEASAAGPLPFRADRPFIYVIKENSTGAIVFMGITGRPEHE